MIRFNRLKIYDNTFKKSLRRKCLKVIFITIKICSASYIICCCRIGTPLGVEMNLEHAHSGTFLGVFLKFFDEHPRPFIGGTPPPPPPGQGLSLYSIKQEQNRKVQSYRV